MRGFGEKFLRHVVSVVAIVFVFSAVITGQAGLANATSFGKPDLTNHRTYMVNGLASAVPTIGYGLKNLQKKLGGKYYAYITPIEASGMEYQILKNIEGEYRKNPNIKINLIGVSYGGNIATWVATRLAYRKIPVNYLGVIDAPAPSAVSSNVHRADNFRCRLLGCIGAPLRRTSGNKSTIMNDFTYRITHIRLPNDKRLQQRIIGQLTDTPLFSGDDLIVENQPVAAPPANTQEVIGLPSDPAAVPQRPDIAKSYLPENVPQSAAPALPQQGGGNAASAPIDLLRVH